MPDQLPTIPPKAQKKKSRTPYLVALLLILASGVAIVVYSLGGWTAAAKAKKLQNPFPPTPQEIDAGMQIYKIHCQSCHGANGDGKGDKADELTIAPADFTDAHKMAAITDGELYFIITKGDQPMPSFDDKLTDRQKWQSVDFIRTLALSPPH